MLVLSLIFLLFAPPLAPAQSARIQCSRADTLQCGIDSLYGSKEFRESMHAALGDRFDPAYHGYKVRFHDAGWAAFKLPQKLLDYAKANKLPDSYFKINQWYLLEISGDEGLLKSFQVDLTFRKYSDESKPADFKVATVDDVRITELPGYKVEEEKQRAIAGKMPVNGFVCESEQYGIIVRAEPAESSRSFGQVLDSVLNPGKEGAVEGDLGAFKVVMSDFGVKRPPQLPPAATEAQMQLGWQVRYAKGTPDSYEAVFTGQAAGFSFRRHIAGYNKIQSYCGGAGDPKDPRRKEICENDHVEEIELQVGDKKWEKPKCNFYEKMVFSR
jgi:hypothetical protein